MNAPISTIVRKSGVYLVSIVLLFLAHSCTYFKAKVAYSDFETSINNIGDTYQYFVLHDGDAMYELAGLTVDSTSVSGNLMPIKKPVLYRPGRTSRIRENERSILNEVHVYLRAGTEALQVGYADIPLTDVLEIRIIDKDNGATTASYVFSTVAVAGAVVIAVAALAFSNSSAPSQMSSCPYVYVNSGETFVFTGEAFGGAVGANLVRDDYMPLPAMAPVDGSYQLRITNELKEKQYTDLAELILVNHRPEQKVLLDKTGNVQVLENLQEPVKATSYSGTDLLPSMVEADSEMYLFNDEDFSENGIVLTFKKPAHAPSGRLLISAKNTLWFDYVIGEFFKKYGGYFGAFMKKQGKISSPDQLETIRDNNFPLSIYAKRNGEWELVDYLMTVGPLAARDFAVPIDLGKYPGEEIEIKIETGFMFWEVDQIAMDFTDNSDLSIAHLQPLSAYGTGQQDWKAALEKTDEDYMAQEKVGEVTELRYAVPPVPAGQVQSAFLHTRGYYELIRDFTGFPKIAELNKFKDGAYFSTFSRAGYFKVLGREGEVE
ncbi:hypothetical protein [Neolewinella persica]|uniref:hypothetical protein n=1 Tax=Neolewinella persica TaxID=70998 RepID=UPI00036E1466|nr:hypothetical protein [Neolewinella persica]